MNTKKIVVLADIESVRVPFTSFEKALKEVSKYGDVAGCKFYGYSAKRTKDYADFIADNNYEREKVNLTFVRSSTPPALRKTAKSTVSSFCTAKETLNL